MGQIVFQATLGGQTALVGQNTASSFSLNLPLANDTLVGKATTDTLTNKTLTSPTITGATLTTSAFNGTIGATTPSTAVVTSLTNSALTSGRVTYAGTGGLLQDSANLVFNGTQLGIGTSSGLIGALSLQQVGGVNATLFNTTNDAYTYLINNGSEFRIQNTYNTTAGYKPITFYANGSENMRITSTGNVGIGTSSPGARLQVVGSGGGQLFIDNAGGGSNYYDATNHYFRSGSGTTQEMILDSSGRLGIGISSPDAPLSVRNPSVTGNQTVIDVIGATSSTQLFGIQTNQTTDVVSLGSLYAGSLAFVTNATERMRLDTSGNLGIGTNSPSSPLSITTSLGSIASLNSTNANGGYLGIQKSGVAVGYIGSAAQLASGSASDMTLRADANLIFTSNGSTERMRIDSSGNLLVGRTSASDTTVGATLYANGTVTAARASSSNGDANFYLYSTTAGAARFYVDMAGTIHATSIVITAISDQKLKENIRDLDTGLSTVMALKPRRFDWKEGKGQDKKNAAGFIAQEFQEVLPNSISTFKAGEDKIEYLAMNHEELIPTLVKAIQEQQAIIEQLKAKVGI
jgi:hypothetical protein